MDFRKLGAKFDLPELEKKVLRFWKRNNTLKKYLEKNEDSSRRFSFIDGPITANNPMGVHHARGRSLKDLFQRYKNMRGYKQRFQNGFDCQGLWVEVEVEKSLGFDSKRDIEEYGLAEFTRACKQRVREFAGKIEEQSRRLGYFMDWENSYFTLSERNNLHIWSFLKKCHRKDLIYEGKSVTVWCPRCETGLSKHEQAGHFKEIQDPSFYIRFEIKGRKEEYFLVWTTTPWTLPANVLLAVDPDLEYVKARKEDQTFYLAREAAERLNFEEMESVDPECLLAFEYLPPYPELEPQQGVSHFVVEWDEVDPGEGTGVVHIAPGCGEEDFELGKREEADVLSPLLPDGRFRADYGPFSGKEAHRVVEEVASSLREKGLLFKREKVTHSYPHCWRCKAKTVFRAEDNWFLNCEKIRGRLKERAEEVNWIPGFTFHRMEDWLENMGDWMISRSRFYGLALPFYKCGECGELTVVGSKEELADLALNPEEVGALPSLHRPWIDRVEIECPSCGGTVKRIPEVGDCWLDAGVVPFSTLDYGTDKAFWKKWFPAHLITEMIEQVRLWYFSMLVYGVVLEDTAPYLNAASYVEVRDEEGREMHKSWGNAIPFDEAAEEMGADAMRWLYFSKKGRAPVNFGYDLAEKVKRSFFFTLWNCFRFFLNYASLEIEDKGKLEGRTSSHPLDGWILSRLSRLQRKVEEGLEEYDSARPVKALEEFVRRDLSLWYIRRSRGRIGPASPDGEDKLDCYAVFYRVLKRLVLLLAPFIPFFSEKLWRRLGEKGSVHLASWPGRDKGLLDEELEQEMAWVRETASLLHKARKEAGVKLRQPLLEAEVRRLEPGPDRELRDLLKEEVNVEKLYLREQLEKEGWVLAEEGKTKVGLNPEPTEDLKREGVEREIVRHLQSLRKKAGLTPADRISVFYVGKGMPARIMKQRKEKIKKATIGGEMKKGRAEVLAEKEIEVGGETLWLGVKRK